MIHFCSNLDCMFRNPKSNHWVIEVQKPSNEGGIDLKHRPVAHVVCKVCGNMEMKLYNWDTSVLRMHAASNSHVAGIQVGIKE